MPIDGKTDVFSEAISVLPSKVIGKLVQAAG